MTPQEKRDFYLKLYEAEHRHRDAIASSLNYTVTTLVAATGAILYLVHGFPSKLQGGLAWLTLVLIVLAACTLVMAAFSLGIAWIGPTYSHFPPPDQLEEWLLSNQPYHEAHPQEVPSLEQRLSIGVSRELAEATSKNRRANIIRSHDIFLSRTWALVAIALAGLAAVPYTIITRQ